MKLQEKAGYLRESVMTEPKRYRNGDSSRYGFYSIFYV